MRRYKFILLVLLLLYSVNIKPNNREEFRKRPKIGLVLSGGGAKGVAHIGALKVIEEAGLPIDYICGTSMGAIVGGLYSIGYSAQELDSIVRAQDWMYLFSDKIDRTHRSFQSKIQNDIYLLSIPFNQRIKISKPTGIMKGQSILNKFSDLTIGYHSMKSFNDLPIPFSCIAADLISGKEVVIDKGSLPLAMRTSMSVPGFFEPVSKDSLIMIDGGVLNNFPVDVVKNMGADIIIGIDLSTDGIEKPKYQSLLDIANRIAFLSGEEKYAQNKKNVDLYINPRLKGFESVDFNATAIDTMITMGEQATRAQMNKLLKIKSTLRLKQPYKHPKREIQGKADSLHIDSLYIEGLASYNEAWLIKKVGFQPGCNMKYSDIENMLLTLQGLGIFKSVSYKVINNKDGKVSLYVFVEELARGSINIGMHIDTEDVVSALIQAQLRFGEKNQHKLSITTKVNQNPWFNLRYSRSNKKLKNIALTYNLSYKDFWLKRNGERINNINYLRNHFKISFKDFSLKNLKIETGLHYDIYSRVSNLYTPDYKPIEIRNEDYGAAYLKIDFDTTNDRETPTKGFKFTTNSEIYGNHVFKTYYNYFGTTSFEIEGAIPLTKRFTLLPSLYGRFIIGNNIPGFFANYIGGEYNQRYLIGQHAFHGVHFTEIIDNSMLGSKWTFRYQLSKNHFISCIGNAIINSHHIKNIFKEHVYYGGALKYTYNSIIGPISCSFDYSNRSKEIGIFAGIGYFF